MNEENYGLMENIISRAYVQQGKEAKRGLEKKIRSILQQRKLPEEGWSDLHIKHFLHEISLMDSNNFNDNCGVGEREARIASRLVAERHFHLGHGIGRSGDIAAIQPKAAGSSLLAKLTNAFALDVLKLAGVSSTKDCLVVPIATGMALMLTMVALKQRYPNRKYVVWPRIDQKSCFKSILTAGLEPVIVENILRGSHLETDIIGVEDTIKKVGSENVLCVLSTTSCFAPRLPDKLEAIALICKKFSVAHIVNNAYGVQSTKCMHLIQQANRVGRLDVFVQSTDKNFMVPVGGAVIGVFEDETMNLISQSYPGRASASPLVDLFITLLSLGSQGYKQLLEERKKMYTQLHSRLSEVAQSFGESVIETNQNQISIAVSLRRLASADSANISEFGSFLFKRSVSGTRVVTTSGSKVINGYTFKGWGAHCDNYIVPYFTAAASIGTVASDVDVFIKRLKKVYQHFYGNVILKDPISNETDQTENEEAEPAVDVAVAKLRKVFKTNSCPTFKTESAESANETFSQTLRAEVSMKKRGLLPPEKQNANKTNKSHVVSPRSINLENPSMLIDL